MSSETKKADAADTGEGIYRVGLLDNEPPSVGQGCSLFSLPKLNYQTKKADAAELPKGFDRVGLLLN